MGGSSLTGSPACHIPRDVAKKKGKLVIVNLQKTSYDKLSALRIFGKTDEVMEGVMKLLDLKIEKFEDSKAAEDEKERLKQAEKDGVHIKKTKSKKKLSSTT